MKRSFLILAAVAVAVCGVVGAMLVTADPAPAATSLSTKEAADLQYVREEEKLARDVYLYLDILYGDQVFTFANIAVSETRHTLAIKDLLTRYGVWDPAGTDVPGVFWNAELQDLYDLLASTGDDSLKDALEVGVAIEELDIGDLTACLADTTHKDIATVYTHLRDASYSHLAAFEQALAK
jgi:hypothetical protein